VHRQGLALGATSVEVTAKLTKDGFIALEHDAEVLNDAGELIITSESNFDELKTGTLELETFIDIVRGHGMNIMIQVPSNAPVLVLSFPRYAFCVMLHSHVRFFVPLIAQNNPSEIEPGYDPTNRVAEVIVDRILAADGVDPQDVLISAFDIGTIARVASYCNGCGIK
jgi:glycerophosphoryl diester phosphodiesterase